MSLEEYVLSIETDEEMPADKDYKEILRLEQMLIAENIPYVIRQMFDGWQICYIDLPETGECICSAIQHFGSYGGHEDLIEIMGLTENGEVVEGYLEADEVMRRIRVHYRNHSCDK